jgi:hypothetical protein
MSPTIIEIRPHRWGWKVVEAPGVEPVFREKDQAIDYAENRACFRSGEIRILDSSGNVERVIPFDDPNRSCDAVICVYDEAGNVIETHEHFKGKTNLEITCVVCSDQFPDVKNTFKIVFDGHDSLQFEETS